MGKNMNANQSVGIANGAALSSLLAAGIGSAALGVFTVAVEMSPKTIKGFMNLYNPVGPLSGKTTFATVAYLVAWAVLAYFYRGKEVDERRFLALTFGLVILGILLTFPPIFQLFA